MKVHPPLGLLVLALSLATASADARAEPPTRARPEPPAAAPAPVAGAAAPLAAAPKRQKVTCAQYRAKVAETAKTATFDTTIKVGSWGHVPAELRKLPPRAKLCGADGMGQAIIASPLFGKELEDFYTPLFTKLDFRPLTCEVSDGQTRCRSKRRRDIAILVTDGASEALVISFLARQKISRTLAAGHDH
jgi:hypothetical protein